MALLILSCTDKNDNEEPVFPEEFNPDNFPENPTLAFFKKVDTIILPEMKCTITEMKEKIPVSVISQFESKFNYWVEFIKQELPDYINTQNEVYYNIII